MQRDITEASEVLFGSPPVYTSSARSFYDHFNVQPTQAMVLAFKDHDYSAPAAIYPVPQYSRASSSSSSSSNKQELTDWLLRNRLPTAIELDSDTFQEVMNAAHRPLVVIAAAPINEWVRTMEKMKDVARRWKDSKNAGDVVFAYMDADKWGKWLKSMYGIRVGDEPAVVVANHAVGAYRYYKL